MDKTGLGDRIKGYESISKIKLTKRMPLIIRVDGKGFSKLTKKMEKPYDEQFRDLMLYTARGLLEEIEGAKLAYVQSDEISILITDYDKLTTCSWYDKQVQKITSVSSSIATAYFNFKYNDLINSDKMVKPFGMFDSRCFVIPREEVCNSFIWRQQDATRNSIQGLGQKNFSHKQLQNKSCSEIQDMLMVELGINWNDIDNYFKRGGCVYNVKNEDKQSTYTDINIPIFSKDRIFIDQFVYIDEEVV